MGLERDLQAIDRECICCRCLRLNNNVHNIHVFLCSFENGRQRHDCLPPADQRLLLAMAADFLQTCLQEQQTGLYYMHTQTTNVRLRQTYVFHARNCSLACLVNNDTHYFTYFVFLLLIKY